ncbi:hypothetical protein [Brevundimonas subvibrioides]|uniref:Lipoprotein n=1 Tax=Brevundimonas subvibrioides (strain ATCC 15264 / DSM 4735 / LMG 14903 / NBRC 16000 / CB 81) TaxID=633149 RepID=D9QN46_BRESC|nr:hypothetical protein [Brevundimonas subvibrioides]ADL00247.1 conserved hypothetical protein [Brevundimonas subvibrioides ATCC 15264]
MRLLIAALALMVSACSPMAGQAPGGTVPGQTAEAACAAQNGTMQRVGRLQTLQCVVRYADAGKRCTDGDQCAGDCRFEGDALALVPNAPLAGVCQADSNRFGCQTSIEDGKPTPTLCID